VATASGLPFAGRASADEGQPAGAGEPPPAESPPAASAVSAGELGVRQAAPGETSGTASAGAPVVTVRDTPPKRDMPDYDGRGAPPTTAGDVALWVPRIIFSPVYFVTEFILRRPLGWAIAGAERAGLPDVLYNFFFFGPDHKAGFAPLVFADFGFNPSVGLFAFWDDAFAKGNDLSFHGSLWNPEDWIAGELTDKIHLGHKQTVAIDFFGIRRPDRVFYGLGPTSLERNQSRYGQAMLQASATFDLPLWRSSGVKAGAGVRSVDLYHGDYGRDPSVEVSVARGVFTSLPPGFGSGYTAEYNHLAAAFDTRRPRPEDGSGVRVAAEAEEGNDVRHSPGGGWIRWGGTVGGFWDIYGKHRVLSLDLFSQFADQLGSEPIPFTERVTLGGDMPMPGFFPGRLVGDSAAVATLKYRWPIWVFLDGSLQAAVGNVFDGHLDDFKPSLLRFSSSIGFESVGTTDNGIEILFGIGTETFDHGGQVDSFRFVIGSNRGF
jgi:hypothetical protein